VLKEITDAIARGVMVKLSSFGTFTVRMIGRNPKTGVEAPIVPVALFKASIIKQQIQNNANSNVPSEATGPNFRTIAAEPAC
jgi:integration host factor subunit alpha